MKFKTQYIYYLSGVERRSKLTIESYINAIETFEKWLKANKRGSLLNATTNDVEDYMGYCTFELGNSATTVNRKIAGIQKYYAYCVKKQGMTSNPAKEATRQKVNKKNPRFLTENEVTRLLKSVKKDKRRGIKPEAKVRDYAMLKLFVASGLRVAELCNIMPEHVDFNNQTLYVHSGKGDKDRAVPLGESTIKAIKDYMELRDKFSPKVSNIFVTNRGTLFDRSSMNKKLKTYCQLTGLDYENIHPHTLRHTCATMVYANSGDVRSVQEMLGHSSSEMTSKYVHMVESQVRKAVLTNKFA